MYIDSHCHLHFMSEQDNSLTYKNIIENAAKEQVTRMLCVATELEQMETLVALNKEFNMIDISCGIHPNEELAVEPGKEDYLKYATLKPVVAIGETGLDYYRDNTDKNLQKERFERQIEISLELKKPLIIHTRNAGKDTIEYLESYKNEGIKGVIHCFTETWDFARRALDLGFYISFSGIVTFKNAKDLQDVAKKVPLAKMLIETDAPYLAPVPYRGKINQPSYVPKVAKFIAGLRDEAETNIAKVTGQNYLDFISN